MARMNFFQPMIKEKPKSNPKRLIILVVLLALIGLVAYMMFSMYLEKDELQTRSDSLAADLTNDSRIKAIARVDEKTQKLSSLETYVQDLQIASLAYQNSNNASDLLIHAINNQVPENLFITSVNFSGTSFTAQGSAIDHDVISQFVHNLREESLIYDINISNISSSNSNYDFTFIGNLRDSSISELGQEVPGE